MNPGTADRIDWDGIDLVVFDVDGTLYDQRQLRLAMMRQLLGHCWRTRTLDTLLTLRTFRHVRESLGDEQSIDFMDQQYVRTAQRHGKTPAAVRELASEWMEQRPLASLGPCRYAHVDAVFAGLQAQGKRVAVFSDYPATGKLAALGLSAQPVVCATDPGIARLKPDPKGLLAILEQTGIANARTLMIGDRIDRDAAAAQAAGVRALIRRARPAPGITTFRSFGDAVFQPLLAQPGMAVVS